MHSDRMHANDERTGPYNVQQTHTDALFLCGGTKSLHHGGTHHFKIGYSWHDVLPSDHMISQEKLLTVKGRTEALLNGIGTAVLHQWQRRWCQRMLYSQSRIRCRCRASCGPQAGHLWLCLNRTGLSRKPIVFVGKRVGWQADPIRQVLSIEELPIDVHSLHPERRNICEILLLIADIRQELCVFISFKGYGSISWGATLYLTCIYPY